MFKTRSIHKIKLQIIFYIISDPDTTYEEDMQILRVIEAYCVSSAPKNRQTIASSGK